MFFLQHIKMPNPKEIENLETVIERNEKVIGKLEIERINETKKLEEIETATKRIRRTRKRKNKWNNN